MKKVDLLQYRQNMSLEDKIMLTKHKIFQFQHKMKETVISFSGGKDSTVLLDIVRQDFPDTPAVFINTGLEYPEIVEFVKTIKNVETIRPKMNFKKVIEKYGYPVISKEVSGRIYEVRNSKSQKLINIRLYGDEKGNIGKISEKWKYLINSDIKISSKCCDVMKKRPFKKVMKNYSGVYIGTMASDSRLRKTAYLRTGCLNYENGQATPLAFWTEKDIWEYIRKYNLRYSKIYDMGYKRTGCMFCMFGVHLEEYPNRFQRMEKTHPKIWKYCINNLGLGDILKKIKVNYHYETELFKGGKK